MIAAEGASRGDRQEQIRAEHLFRCGAPQLAPALTAALAIAMVAGACGDHGKVEALQSAAVADLLGTTSADSIIRFGDGDTLRSEDRRRGALR